MKKTDKQMWEKVFAVLFFLYLLFIIRMIVFKYPLDHLQDIVNAWQKDVVLEGLQTANFVPFKTIKMYIRYYDMPGIRSFSNLFGNILIFVPVGIMLPIVHGPSKNVFILLANVLFLIIGIEIFQLFSNFGAFDVDDIILNGFGCLLGRCIYGVARKKKGENT